MRKWIGLVLLAAVLAGCEDFPIEGGDDLSAAQAERVAARHTHGGLDDRLLDARSGR